MLVSGPDLDPAVCLHSGWHRQGLVSLRILGAHHPLALVLATMVDFVLDLPVCDRLWALAHGGVVRAGGGG